MLAFVDFIIDGLENSEVSIMVMFCGLAVLSLGVTLKLPETFGKKRGDFIEELAVEIKEKGNSRSIG